MRPRSGARQDSPITTGPRDRWRKMSESLSVAKCGKAGAMFRVRRNAGVEERLSRRRRHSAAYPANRPARVGGRSGAVRMRAPSLNSFSVAPQREHQGGMRAHPQRSLSSNSRRCVGRHRDNREDGSGSKRSPKSRSPRSAVRPEAWITLGVDLKPRQHDGFVVSPPSARPPVARNGGISRTRRWRVSFGKVFDRSGRPG